MVFDLISIIIAYVVGSVPTGYLAARASGIADIRQFGSGNIGATNVARILGTKYFFVVFALDFGKAYGMLYWAGNNGASELITFLIACALFLGNIASLFLQFSGGRGIATGAGIMMFFSPITVVTVFVPWFILLVVSRTVGIASIGALLLLPFVAFFFSGSCVFVIAFLISLISLIRHHKHIASVIKNLYIAS